MDITTKVLYSTPNFTLSLCSRERTKNGKKYENEWLVVDNSDNNLFENIIIFLPYEDNFTKDGYSPKFKINEFGVYISSRVYRNLDELQALLDEAQEIILFAINYVEDRGWV